MNFNVHDPVHVTGAASLVSASTTITMFGLSVGELGVAVSALIAVATFVLHVWYTFRKDARERELHARRHEALDVWYTSRKDARERELHAKLLAGDDEA